MPEITISLQNTGERVRIQREHNNREYDENGQPYFSKNVDTSLSKNNWYWEGNMSVEEFYKKEFEPYFSAQTEKIKNTHPERLKNRKKSYLEQVISEQLESERKRDDLVAQGLAKKDINKQMSATTKMAYETIVQLGDRESIFGTLQGTEQGRQIAKKVMLEFIDNWKEKYPQMKFINIAIHADEIGTDKLGGTVHMHITYCPVCTSYKKGMPVRNSLTGALKEMGFVADRTKNAETGEFQLAIEKWQQELRAGLEKQIEKYGFTKMQVEDTRRENESAKDYGKRKDQMRKLAEQEKRLSKKEKALNTKEKELSTAETEIHAMRKESIAEMVEREQDIIEKHVELTDRENEIADRESQVAQREKELSETAEQTIVELKSAVDDAVTNFKGSTGTRANEYPVAKFNKGCRAVPEKDLEQLVGNSWFRPEYVKKKMDEIIDKFNDLPFVRSAYQQIHRLEQQIHGLQNTIIKLKAKIETLTHKNREQQEIIDKAKELHMVSGKSYYQHFKELIEQDKQNREEHDIDDD